ncbi:unnamed protein product [Polarella glacialis]|uniref:FAD-dependent oxidoreductase 2 FAD-binding domain-containing protein n=1 Tax=Polarella glacialis TaxID=89957 RepID=A0A813LB89_POLGL|nr:unnamed protein product [Polarella glacialis]
MFSSSESRGIVWKEAGVMATSRSSTHEQVVVVGGGLAGMTATISVLESGGRVVLLDKASFCGGNSMKATAGISGAGTRMQMQQGIADSSELMMEDTLRGGASSTEMVRILCENSGPDLEWLQSTFDLDLSLVARLGGHSQPRTHRGRGFPGMTITFAVLQMLEKIAEGSDRVRIVSGARVVRLLVEDGQCMGCVYQKDGQECEGHGPVVVATGGFGADFTETSLLAQHRPDLLHLPTTSGRHCTGDGIKLGQSIGAGTVDLEWVQLHPTGLVKPDDPDAKFKYLIDDGVGSLIVNADGRRFVNEFGRRDYIVEQLWKNKPPFRLLLNQAGTAQIPWHCEHYARLGVMRYYPSGEELARDMGVPLSVLEATHEDHYQAALQTEDDPDGGPWPAFPSGRSWDEASGKTGAGKRFFHNALPGLGLGQNKTPLRNSQDGTNNCCLLLFPLFRFVVSFLFTVGWLNPEVPR